MLRNLLPYSKRLIDTFTGMTGYLGNLTPDEKQTLSQFRNNLSDVLEPSHDDKFLLRWLRARKFDLQNSESMLRNNLNWRKENDIDNILTTFMIPKEFKRFKAGGFLGFDKEGCPIRVIIFGGLDFVGGVKAMPVENLYKLYIIEFEENLKMMKEQTEKLGHSVDKHVYIIDAENLSISYVLKKQVIEIAYEMVKIYEQNYPETLKKVYIVNVSYYQYALYKIIANLIPVEIFHKFAIFSSAEDSRKALLNEIDADILPAIYGGTRVDPDGNPRCLTVLEQGGKVPEEYYMENRRHEYVNSASVTKISISSGSVLPIEIPVKTAGTTIRWEFQTMDRDIIFGLFFKDANNLVEIFRPTRYSCVFEPESGHHLCDKAGIYVLKFDNSFSWLRQVTLGYKVELAEPESTNM